MAEAISKPTIFHHEVSDLKSVKVLPDSHAWTNLSPLDNVKTCYSKTIPIIDLNDDDVIEQIRHACRTWGAFQVINHNVPKNLFDQIELVANNLFSLPLEHKLKAANAPGSIAGYGLIPISSFFPKGMWYEGFTIVNSPIEHARKLWPDSYHIFCDAVEDYKQGMNKLATRLLWLMFEGLGISKEDVQWATLEQGSAVITLNFYPACPEPEKAMGIPEHTDSSILTIIHQTDVAGLQVHCKESNTWTTVKPHPDALVIVIGDLIHISSNGLYQSALHRAMVNEERDRLSIPYFYGSPPDVEVGPIPKLVDDSHPPQFKAIKWSDYLDMKAKIFTKALHSLRISSAPKDEGQN